MRQLSITLIGEVKSPKAYLIRDFLQRNGFAFQWIEVTTDAEARQYAGLDSRSDPRFPVLALNDRILYAPTLPDIVAALDLSVGPQLPEYDLAIYGAGPAGLSAAVYGASEGLRTILVERFSVGGQAGSTSRIENYLGFPEGISGADLASRAKEQAWAAERKRGKPSKESRTS
jgi:thioredoxin reductase (NADPH)